MFYPILLAFQEITERPITVSTTVGQVIAWILIGLIAGLLASILVRGRMSLAGVVLLGLIGAVIGGYIFDALDISATGSLSGGIIIRWIDILAAFIGAVLIMFIASAFVWRRF